VFIFGVGHNNANVVGSLGNVALDIHGETRGFGDGEAEVERNAARNGTETDENTPTVVDLVKICGPVNDTRLVCLGDNECNKSSG
jgi:hypothetical protein